MGRDSVLLTYVGVDILFVVGGVALLVFALTTQNADTQTSTIENVKFNLLFLQEMSSTAVIGNAVLVFVTFVASIPAIVIPTIRGWLKLHGYLAVVCALYTMILGLTIWFETLKQRKNLGDLWAQQPATTQSLLQQSLKCCGYANSTSPPFVVDNVCTNSLVAVNLGGCVSPFSTFANNYLDVVFTAAFGIVGIDVLLILSTAILLKDRKEKERYRHIDEKNGAGAF